MTRLPCEPVHILGGVDGPVHDMSDQCANPSCDMPAAHSHHIVRSSYLGGPFPYVRIENRVMSNVCGLCFSCHNDVTEGRERIVWGGDDFWYWGNVGQVATKLDPHPPGLTEEEPGGGKTPNAPLGSSSVSPGDTCPTCERRVPHPKKTSSPKTKTMSLRVPVDAADDFDEIYEAAARHLGCYEEPHWKYKTALTALALLLQEDKPGERVA